MKKSALIIVLLIFAGCSRDFPVWFHVYPHDRGDIVSVSIRFQTGSAMENPLNNGITRLTMNAVLKTSSKNCSKDEIHRDLMNMAISEAVIVDAEVSGFVFRLHHDHFNSWLSLLGDRMKNPRFLQDEIDVLSSEYKNDLEQQILFRSEDFSRDLLVQTLYNDHPYALLPAGNPATFSRLTSNDLNQWWKSNFSVNNLEIAVSGPLTEDEKIKLTELFAGFNSNVYPDSVKTPEPKKSENVQYVLVENESGVSALSVGWHIPYNRSDPEFYPLWIFASWLGEHRTFYGHFMKELRVKRGFNYGDYAYAEHVVHNSYSVFPQPGHPRSYQYFSVWIRPLENRNLPFALRLVLHDLDNLKNAGMDSVAFENTRTFLKSYINLYAGSQADFMGFNQDAHFYSLCDFPESTSKLLDSLDYKTANEIIKNSIGTENLAIVIVGGDRDSLIGILRSGIKTEPVYRTSVSRDVRERDKKISVYPFPEGKFETFKPSDFIKDK